MQNIVAVYVHANDKVTITLDEEKYVSEILAKFKIMVCKSTKISTDPSLNLSKVMYSKDHKEKDEIANVLYQQAVVTLIYIVGVLEWDI
ncbi:hypothetical protein Trydic_g22509 [Trypoxylus dichotomus]